MDQELAAEKSAHEATKRQLTTANKARAYESKKASECASEAAAEIYELKKENERMRTHAEAHATEENELIAANRKLRSYNEQQKRNIDQMRRLIQALQNAQQLTYGSTPLSYMRGEKREADLSDKEIPADIPRHKKPKSTTLTCTQCLSHGWKDCDGKAPCENCKLRGKSDKCKRVMGKYFKKDTCANQFCTMAHEGDGYSKLVPFTRLHKLPPSSSPLETKALIDAKGREKAEKLRKDDESAHDGLFEELSRRYKKGNDSGNGGGACPV